MSSVSDIREKLKQIAISSRNKPLDPSIADEAINWDEDTRKIFNEELANQRLNLADEKETFVKAWHYDPKNKLYYPLLGNNGLMPSIKAKQAYRPGEMVSYNVTNVPHERPIPLSGYSAGKFNPKAQGSLFEYGVEHPPPKGMQLVFTRVVGGKEVDPSLGHNMTHGPWHIYYDAGEIDPSDQKVVREMPDFEQEQEDKLQKYTKDFLINTIKPEGAEHIMHTYLNGEKNEYVDDKLDEFLVDHANSTKLGKDAKFRAGTVLGKAIVERLNEEYGWGLNSEEYDRDEFSRVGRELILEGVDPKSYWAAFTDHKLLEELLDWEGNYGDGDKTSRKLFKEYMKGKVPIDNVVETVRDKKDERLDRQFNTDILSAPNEIKSIAKSLKQEFKSLNKVEEGYVPSIEANKFLKKRKDDVMTLVDAGYMIPELIPYLSEIKRKLIGRDKHDNVVYRGSPEIRARLQSKDLNVNVNDAEAFNKGAAKGGVSDALVKTIHRRF
jgi:hypothetical protein